VRPGQTIHSTAYERRPGGKGANQAVAVARAGGLVQIHGSVGKDGPWVVELIGKADVDVSNVVVLDNLPTGRAIIQLSSSGENAIGELSLAIKSQVFRFTVSQPSASWRREPRTSSTPTTNGV
jgi:sugar/nucleoside kinase (ribokinase family)